MSVLSPLLAFAIVLGALPAWAGPSKAEFEQAHVLFERGRALVKDGDFEHACPLFEESQRLVPALGTELNLAQCWAETGKLLAAKELYASVAARAAEAHQQARVDYANDGLAALEKRVPHLDIAVVHGPAKVTLDDKPVELGSPIPVDPGFHRVVATGKHTVESTVETKPDGKTVTVELDVDPVVEKVEPPPPPPPPPPAHSSSRTRAAQVLAIGGGTAILASIGLGAVAQHKGKAQDDCLVEGDVATCPPSAAKKLRSARTWGNAATITFAGGAVLATTAAILYFTRSKEHPSSPAVHAAVTSTSGSLVVEGRW